MAERAVERHWQRNLLPRIERYVQTPLPEATVENIRSLIGKGGEELFPMYPRLEREINVLREFIGEGLSLSQLITLEVRHDATNLESMCRAQSPRRFPSHLVPYWFPYTVAYIKMAEDHLKGVNVLERIDTAWAPIFNLLDVQVPATESATVYLEAERLAQLLREDNSCRKLVTYQASSPLTIRRLQGSPYSNINKRLVELGAERYVRCYDQISENR